ncbi:hypothetical protein ACI48J_05270 [Paenibacillus chitinolyticus]|uniref:hypothetical protein n=1 Tax=Paenibacillus chitinolyticus TaxID=79263 RepID=UPI002DB82617|nr:hypothetical protein [Paenibacillus chitinolyticus]MEC0247594.1 hypothetical protein [Paenibacillus chitinolyticus]
MDRFIVVLLAALGALAVIRFLKTRRSVQQETDREEQIRQELKELRRKREEE